MDKKSILTKHPVVAQTPPNLDLPKVAWDINKFESLIYNHGYHSYIEKALRCPCCEKASGQALTTCRNCLGRGWIFVDKRETKVVSQGMNNQPKNTQTGEINRGIARITTRAIDQLGFMDRIQLLDLLAYHTEILRPRLWGEDEILLAYPIYEPLEVTNIYLFVGDNIPLKPLTADEYTIIGNQIEFSKKLLDEIEVTDMNQRQPDLSVTIRYSYHPVYHVLDVNRELMKVRERGCYYSDDILKNMPINVMAKKAHYIFDNQQFGEEQYDNTVLS